MSRVHFPDHRVLRAVSKRRMFKKLKENYTEEAKQSYLGLLKHGNTWNVGEEVKALDSMLQ